MLKQLIDIDNFKYPYYLPIEHGDDLENNLNEIIDYYQVNILKLMLGDIEYVKFRDDLDIGGTPQSQKWIDFLDGTQYFVENKKVLWLGFRDLLVPFIWCYFKKDQLTIQQPISQIQPISENSNLVGAEKKFVEIWNQGQTKWGLDWNNLFIGNCGKYPVKDPRLYFDHSFDLDYNRRVNFRKRIFDENIEKYKHTVYNFMFNRYKNDFPDWQFTELTSISQFNL